MAKQVFLDFEKELGDIAAKIDDLENEELESGRSHKSAIVALERDLKRRTAEIYKDLPPWQTAQVARHPNRPYTLDYISAIFEDFHELHGDRNFADDQSVVGGLARLAEHAVMVIGHQKGRDTRERTRRNFGMTKPEGYRKALRLMKLAEKFKLPVFTFVDTPGAYPGIDAEERNQSEAIGRNIFELSKLRVPVISTIIGEGGSGGALAIAVADSVLMLQYSTYSVISPEGCASILWKSAAKAPEAASALGLTAERLLELYLVDKVISEPLGGAHRDPKLMASTLKKVLVDQLKAAKSLTVEELLERRLERIMNYGRFESRDPTGFERLNAQKEGEPMAPAVENDDVIEVESVAKPDLEELVDIEIKALEKPRRAPRKRTAKAAEAETPVKTKTASKRAAAKKPSTRKTQAAKAAETSAAVEEGSAQEPKAAPKRRRSTSAARTDES